MVRSFRFNVWCLCVASLLTLASGCNSTPKTSATGILPQKTPAVAAKPVPEPAEFTFGKELKDPVKVHLAYALWHEQEGNSVEARNSYDKVLEKSPRNVDAMLGLARLDIALGRMDDAEKRLLKAQKLAPKNAKVAISFGQYYSARGEWSNALEHMKQARSLSPYDQACAYHLGYVQAKLGDTTAALASFTEAVGTAEAQYNLAYILHEQGNLTAAEEHLLRAITLKPELPQAQSLLIAIRRQRQSDKTQLAQSPNLPAKSQRNAQTIETVQPAGYTQPAPPIRSAFDPPPAR